MCGTEPLAYFITFRTYATWLHGDERGSVDRAHRAYGRSLIPANERWLDHERSISSGPFELSADSRVVVDRTIREVCGHNRWSLAALNVRTNHVHAVVSAREAPEKIMNAMKSWSTRRLREAGLVADNAKVWARHGSTRWLWTDRAFARAVHYTLHEQGDGLAPEFGDDQA